MVFQFPISIDSIRNAATRIAPYIRPTPLDFSVFDSKRAGASVYYKFENCQRTGSFKIRGALNKMLQLGPEAQKIGIIAASAGNHAQGVGFAAKLLGIPATIVVPKNTPQTKIDAIREFGVDLLIHGEIYDDAEAHARRLERETGKIFVSAYNDYEVIAGQGTLGLEIIEQLPDIDFLVVPLSGGGLLAGVALAVKSLRPTVKIYGIQSEACPVMVESMRVGQIVDVPMQHSIAEGLHGGVEKGSVTFPMLQRLIDGVLLVSEEEIKNAIRDLVSHHHQIAEGAGAVSVAAILRYRDLFHGKQVVGVISGGNLDIHELQAVLCSQSGSQRAS
jgi:threonine dehydratase